MVRVLVIDNFDSFVYNIVQYLGEMGADITVHRNDTPQEDLSLDGYDRIVISPGPGHPSTSGISLDILRTTSLPTLGVCLGHQALGHIEGASIIQAPSIVHGKAWTITHDGSGVFEHVRTPLSIIRYHSLIVDRETLPGTLRVTAETDDGIIMGLAHTEKPLYGVQFHPESILSQDGKVLLRTFLEGNR